MNESCYMGTGDLTPTSPSPLTQHNSERAGPLRVDAANCRPGSSSSSSSSKIFRVQMQEEDWVVVVILDRRGYPIWVVRDHPLGINGMPAC
mmetsp:Transcript_7594/g.18511  ORF Transcript_7594/g.18511 Transcript_7594/m.18511 type:complete len:91 (+) Transcript_7594:40-312(+)